METMSSFNNSEIRYYLLLCRRFPGDARWRELLHEELELRRAYRSDEPRTVYKVDDTWYFTKEDAQTWIDNMVWDEPPTMTTGTMTGREFGRLRCDEC